MVLRRYQAFLQRDARLPILRAAVTNNAQALGNLLQGLICGLVKSLPAGGNIASLDCRVATLELSVRA